jgi:uncharacterized protein (DUF4213/DUF364 family)
MIIEQTYSLLKQLYGDKLNKLVVADVRIGLYLTAVRLSDASVGTSATLDNEHPFCAKSDRDFGDFTPLKIRGKKVMDILDTQKKSGTISSLKTAVLSATSSKIISSGKYKIIDNYDPIQLLDLNSVKRIAIVGAFQSYIRKVSQTGNRLSVLELNENALAPEQKKYYVPAGEYKKILPESDIVIITGQTLVNRTIDDLLSVIAEGTQVVVTGPSSNIIPDILFKNKVSIIGAVRITDPEVLFDVVSEGGTGYHLFEYCARKICILKGDE